MAATSNSRCCLFKEKLYRYSGILLLCTVELGVFTIYDSPGSLQEPLMEHLGLSSYEFSLIYSVSSWPSVVLCVFGGYLVDRFFGAKWGTIIYVGVASLGHVIFSLGVLLEIYWLSLVGRFIFGAGVESTLICLQCYAVIWFKRKELSMAICFMISTSRIGTSIMYEVATPLYNAFKDNVTGSQAVGIVYFIVSSLMLASVTSGFIVKRMDPKKYDKPHEVEVLAPQMQQRQDETVSFRDILHFPTSLWIITVTHCAFTTSVYAFIPFSQGFFTTHFHLTIETANNLTSFFSILSAVAAPFFGILVDKFGRNIYFLMIGLFKVLVAHLILTFASTSPYVGMFFMSIGLAEIFSGIAPMPSFIIPEYRLGTAFGAYYAIVNLSYSINPIVAGTLVDKYNFTAMELYLTAWITLGMITAVCLWLNDRNGSGILNMSPTQRKLLEAEKEAKKDELKKPLNAVHL